MRCGAYKKNKNNIKRQKSSDRRESFLKAVRSGIFLIVSGNSFHTLIAAKLNALSP
jgi:hypothetical protein